MAYESPIRLVTEIENKIIEDQTEGVYKAVLAYKIDISKDELFKLLYGDRKQYEKGFEDGWKERDKSQVRCKDCKWRDVFDKCVAYEAFWDLGDDGFYNFGERKDEVEAAEIINDGTYSAGEEEE